MRAFIKRSLLPLAVVLITLCSCPLAASDRSAMECFVDGVDAFGRGSYLEAMGFLKKALELEPTNLEFSYYLGLTLAAMERYGEALKVFESIVEQEPVTYRKASFEIAAIHARRGAYQEVLTILTTIEDLAPQDARVYLEKGYALRKLRN
jgi:tetratricopeptide (TPR) repeat protein